MDTVYGCMIDMYLIPAHALRQLDDEDVKSDSDSSNGDFPRKSPAKKDYVSALVGQIKKYDWKRDQCKFWFKNDIKHCLKRSS